MEIKIRKAKIDDSKKISYLIQSNIKKILYKYYTSSFLQEMIRSNNPKKIEKRIKSKNVFCAVKGNRILGVIDTDENKIGGFYVNYNFLKKGIGSKLFDYAENELKKNGFKIIKLYPTDYSLNFYLKRGYIKKRVSYWKINNDEKKVFEMFKRT